MLCRLFSNVVLILLLVLHGRMLSIVMKFSIYSFVFLSYANVFRSLLVVCRCSHHLPALNKVVDFCFATMFTKLCIAAATSALVSAEDPSVTMFLADTGHAASMWQDEREFESGVRRVMQLQTTDLEKMINDHPRALLLQTEIATQKV